MEGELAKTVEAMDGVSTAVVHLALPQKQVFADKQDPPTASVLVQTKPGVSLDAEQVQSIVHLVAASIDGMDASDVTVADSTGKLLSTTDSAGGELASSQDQYTQDYQQQMQAKLQSMLDRVVGPGNSTVQVTADLNFDKTVVEDRTFKKADPKGLASSLTTSTETYKGPGAAGCRRHRRRERPDGHHHRGRHRHLPAVDVRQEVGDLRPGARQRDQAQRAGPGLDQLAARLRRHRPDGGREQQPGRDHPDAPVGGGVHPQAR